MPGENYHLINEKLRVPAHRGVIERPRLISLANKSIAQFPATLISGRAGTGKTAFAASFAAHNKKVCWYSVESTDAEWSSFARYFSASLLGVDRVSGYAPPTGEASEVTQNDIARFLVQNFAQPNVFPIGQPALIVLDDIHHIFDALWFDEFFNLLLYSLPGEAHLLMLCRSRPPGPLMRLRSKQMLNLLEEKVIAFTEAETEALLDSVGLPTSYARDANRECFGRISKLLEFVRNASTTLPSS
jgi:ATP/maltotriose-dependent transcriptional regulator MalT